MLGALLSNATSALKPGHRRHMSEALESTQEDMHTRALLFPNIAELNQSQDFTYPLSEEQCSTGVLDQYEILGNIDLDCSRDVRIVIAQDGAGSQPKMVLYDSKPPPSGPPALSSPRERERDPSESSRQSQAALPLRTKPVSVSNAHGDRTFSPLMRTASTFGQSPSTSPSSLFDRPRRRGTAPNGSFSSAELNSRFIAREPAGDMKTLLDCMFGTAPLSYRGDSTKLHVFPRDITNDSRSTVSPVGGEGFGSWGRAEGKRKSQLARTHTVGDVPGLTSPSSSYRSSHLRARDQRTILITRTFSVNIADRGPNEFNGLRSPEVKTPSSVGTTDSFPFPHADGSTSAPSPSQLKQLKSPMYAIAIILQIPVSATTDTSTEIPAVVQRSGLLRHGNESMTSSFGSDARLGSMFSEIASALDSSSSLTASESDVDDCVDLVVQRWDVIARVLASVQASVRCPLRDLLHREAITSPLPRPPTGPQLQTQVFKARGRSFAEADTSQFKHGRQFVQLLPGALASNDGIVNAVASAADRLVSGLRIPRVVTGQGRWGVWRDEARWVAKWAGGKEQQFFFYNLLTAFLGNHTDWLVGFGPVGYRYRYEQQQQQQYGAGGDEDYSIAKRTVIVSNDRVAARRLLFLLSAFLPAADSAYIGCPPKRAALGRGNAPFSQSLPSSSQPREPSLRRTIKRRGATQAQARSTRGHERQISTSGRDGAEETSRGISIHLPGTLTIQGQDNARKSSLATVSTVTPVSTITHFSTGEAHASCKATQKSRQGSNASLASINLAHTLRHNDSSDSQSSSRWGSLISGIWGTQQRSSAAVVSDRAGASEGLGISGLRRPETSEQQLAGAQDVLADDGGLRERPAPGDSTFSQPWSRRSAAINSGLASGSASVSASASTSISSQVDKSLVQNIPSNTKRLESQLKTSVDEIDGIIDVDIQTPDFHSSSFGSSAAGSPANTHAAFRMTASFDGDAGRYDHRIPGFPPTGGSETANPTNVAGCLRRFHPDIAVQAVKTYAGLDADIVECMKREPTPGASMNRALAVTAVAVDGEPSSQQHTVDVCTTLIADMASFTIRRVRLQRRIEIHRHHHANTATDASIQAGSATTKQPVKAEDTIVTESVFDMETILVEAIERIIAPSNPTSTATSSRSSSRHRPSKAEDTDRVPPQRAASPPLDRPPHASPPGYVPRGDCQGVILNALSRVVGICVEDFEENAAASSASINAGETHRAKVAVTAGKSRAAESSLRDGIKGWLSDVATASTLANAAT
ncbi:MAG: hypothetical protein M1825_005401 [Sarcosagium campestre]|nr:MAG: hypothetical protein M1825_005401 [Sarcosagium campestre]